MNSAYEDVGRPPVFPVVEGITSGSFVINQVRGKQSQPFENKSLRT